MKRRFNTHKIVITSFLVVITIIGYSLPGGPPPAGAPPAGGAAGTPPCWAPPCVPIDGGIGILLAAGAFVGARKLYRATRG